MGSQTGRWPKHDEAALYLVCTNSNVFLNIKLPRQVSDQQELWLRALQQRETRMAEPIPKIECLLVIPCPKHGGQEQMVKASNRRGMFLFGSRNRAEKS